MIQLIFKRIYKEILPALGICMLLLIDINAQAVSSNEIPNIISFNAKVFEQNGLAIKGGVYDITFLIYDSPEGGKPLWVEKQENVKVSNGYLQSLFGNEKSNPLKLKFNKKYYVAIKLNNQSELQGRIELVTTPFSLGSKYANDVADNSIGNNSIKDGAITDSKIKNVSWSKLSDEDPDPLSIYWTILGNIIYGPERNYVGTIEEKNFIIKTFSIQRLLFDPYGHVLMGTPQDSVKFELIGFSTFSDDMHIKDKMGVGIDTDISTAKVHIRSDNLIPFRVDYQNNKLFTIDKNGHVIIKSSATGNQDNLNSYPVYIKSPDQGIAIQVKGAGKFGEAYGGVQNSPSGTRTNSFITFFDDALEGRAGRIAGENALDYALDAKNIALGVYLPILITAEAVAIANATSVNVASIMAFGAEIAEIGAQKIYELTVLGISYRSGFADYAEWLEKEKHSEKFENGDIVGLFGGKISKVTNGADQLLCISENPIVLGNMVDKKEQPNFEKVTFLGQVPVKVIGKVNKGDFIIASGFEDGTGIAMEPSLMTLQEYSKVIGRAWQSSNLENVKYINTAIGFNHRDIVSVLKKKQRANKSLRITLNSNKQKLNISKNDMVKLEKKIEKLEKEVNEIINRINGNLRFSQTDR